MYCNLKRVKFVGDYFKVDFGTLVSIGGSKIVYCVCIKTFK